MFDKKAIAARFFELHSSLNQKELAKKYGVKQPTVNNWKSGKSAVPWKKLLHAVHEFGVTWDWLLEGREPKYLQPRK